MNAWSMRILLGACSIRILKLYLESSTYSSHAKVVLFADMSNDKNVIEAGFIYLGVSLTLFPKQDGYMCEYNVTKKISSRFLEQ